MTKEYIYLVTDEIQLAPICEDCGPNLVPVMRKEELIRCKDCRYREHMTFSIGDKKWEVNFCGHSRVGDDSDAPSIEESDFCSWAVRKDDEVN